MDEKTTPITSNTHALKEKINEWWEVDVEVYIVVYSLAKERLEDLLGESESVTTKSITMATGLLAFVGFFVGYFFANKELILSHTSILGWSSLIILIELLLLSFLIAPKMVKNRGLPPIISLNDDFDKLADRKHQKQKIYFNTIAVMQDNIDYMLKKNGNRTPIYQLAIYGFVLLAIFIPALTVYLTSLKS